MACELCSASVNIFTRKRCSECHRIHCSKCALKPDSSSKLCIRCHRLLTLTFTRQDLEQYTAKELHNFLRRNNLRTDNFTEKADLVEAVLKLSLLPCRADDSEHKRHVEQLKQRMMQETSKSQATTTPTDNQSSASPDPAFDSALSSPGASSQVNENIPHTTGDVSTTSGAFSTTNEFSSASAAAENGAEPALLPESTEIRPEPMETQYTESTVGSGLKRITLNHLSRVEDIEGLTVRQLKELLVTNYVDYKGCCERQELMDRVKRLWIDNQKNRGLISDDHGNSELDLCKVCMDAVIDCILLECGHMVTCTQCGKRMAECPICRHYVSRVVHVFKA